MPEQLSWEGAVRWLRSQPDAEQLVRNCYYDDPLEEAAERFHQSEEWQALTELLGPAVRGSVLDVGAGRGISSYAFAKSGARVVALEPDASDLVGVGAIKHLIAETGVAFQVIQQAGEKMPFEDGSFDLVFCRAALHHAHNLETFCQEVGRVLRPGGIFLSTREHVISRRQDLESFLVSHPLHHLYGGENAYLLSDYCAAIRGAGLKIIKLIGPYDSPINYFPMTREARDAKVREILAAKVGSTLTRLIGYRPFAISMLARMMSKRSQVPGRHFAFLVRKA